MRFIRTSIAAEKFLERILHSTVVDDVVDVEITMEESIPTIPNWWLV